MDSWPMQPKRNDQASSVSKKRKRTAFSFPVAVNCDFDSLFLKFSSFTKIIDIFAFCFRYITNCKARVGKMKILDSKGKYHVPPLTTYERRQASNKIFLYIQNLFFKAEISCIKANKPVVKKSILSALCPFIDKDGLIRVGGRLRNSTLQYGAKHPIILPNQHEICKLIVNMYHILYLHAGCTVLLGIIKQTYWIIDLKNIVKKCIHKCIVCCRYRATTSKQLMGDLPTHRVTPSRPFSVCGVDYAGPINILRYRGRGAKTTKGYIALFVCFVTKALHLELVSYLTSEAFIASLKRFCARRGAPKHIYCDNGEAITSSPEHTNDDKLSLRSQWDIVQKMKLGFWRKWKIDYLSNLQNRTKWKSPNNNFKVGEIVIKEDNIPPATWPLGKVIETHPGRDLKLMDGILQHHTSYSYGRSFFERLCEHMKQVRKERITIDGELISYAPDGFGNVGVYVAAEPLTPEHNYFEIEIVDPGVENNIVVGLVSAKHPLDQYPGWIPDSIGYHVGDGSLYRDAPKGAAFGPMCEAGDHIGVGIKYDPAGSQNNKQNYCVVFFTNNGKEFGSTICSNTTGALYPAVGFHSVGEEVRLSLDMRWMPEEDMSMCIDSNEEEWSRLHDIKLNGATESASQRPGQGRRRATMPNGDRYLVLMARRHRNMNVTLLQQHFRSATGTTVSTQAVRNRLHGVGMYARRPLRDRGSRNNPAFVHESVRFGGRGVLVYGGISIDGRTDLYIIQGGPLTARRYRDEILRPIVVPYAATIGYDFILMDDNSRPHRANLVDDSLFEEGIIRMEWPVCSPNMNPIEHILEYSGRGKSIIDVGLAQAKYPLDTTHHYFEIEILDPGENCYIAIGLARKDYPKYRHPGWNKGSIAYHADDGKIFVGSGVGDPFGPRCHKGDIMGCGIIFPRDFVSFFDSDGSSEGNALSSANLDFEEDFSGSFSESEDEEWWKEKENVETGMAIQVFFTRNGKTVGQKDVCIPKGGFYPTVGMLSSDERVKVDLHPLTG
ncbi:SPRY domain-containing protein 3 [Trichonephila clavipes]|nr:SPRY domain-containing protein 3 [Trichonephila clavipes]